MATKELKVAPNELKMVPKIVSAILFQVISIYIYCERVFSIVLLFFTSIHFHKSTV